MWLGLIKLMEPQPSSLPGANLKHIEETIDGVMSYRWGHRGHDRMVFGFTTT